MDSHEFYELYRGDKDFRLGIELCKDPDVRYTVLVPDVASPGDRAFFGSERFPRDRVPALPKNMEVRYLRSRLVYFSKRNLSLGGFFQFSAGYPRALSRLRPDVVFENPYTTLTPRSYMTWFAARANRIPMVYVDPGDIPPKGGLKRLLNRVEGPVVRGASHIIVYNEMGRIRFVEEYRIPDERISVVPKPVDTAAFEPGRGREEARSKLGAGSRFLVGYIGRLSNNKGAIHLIEAAARIKEMGLAGEFMFLFAGGNITSADAAPIRALKEKRGLDNVLLTGKVPHSDMAAYQAACDLVVYPDVTNLPGFSTVLAESMAMGKAVMLGIEGFEAATPIRDRVNGRVVRAGDVGRLVEVIRELREDAAQREKYGKAVRQFAEERMDWGKQAKIYKEIFMRAVER